MPERIRVTKEALQRQLSEANGRICGLGEKLAEVEGGTGLRTRSLESTIRQLKADVGRLESKIQDGELAATAVRQVLTAELLVQYNCEMQATEHLSGVTWLGDDDLDSRDARQVRLLRHIYDMTVF